MADRSAHLVPGVIRRRLIAKTLIAIVAILLLTAAISTFFYLGISDELDGQVDNQVEQTTQLHTNVVEQWMTERKHTLEEIERSQEQTAPTRKPYRRSSKESRTKVDFRTFTWSTRRRERWSGARARARSERTCSTCSTRTSFSNNRS
ncbi:hypothetical protein D8S78_13645 [Natrialba swarupiae]|nr:hypothetical protein [Natrialba swarupiae]